MTKVLASGAVRFMLAGALIAALATCFVGRAEASSVFSSPFASPSVFANSAATGASVVAGDRALTLKWSAVKGAAGYRVSWRGRVLKGGKPTAAWSAKWLGLKVLKTSARSYKATGLANGAQYQLRLESNTKAKKSRWVAKLTLVGKPSQPPTPVLPATVPGPPTAVTGVGGDGEVAVSWTAPTNNGGSAITAYTATAVEDPSKSCSSPAFTTCTVADLTNATPYTFTVVAANVWGTSTASDPSVAVTPFGVPDAPTTVSGVAGDTSVTVSWSAPSSDGGSAVTDYTVTADGDGGSQTCTTSDELLCPVTGLTNGTPYTFTVKATNARGDSGASEASPAVTPSAPSCANGGVCVVGSDGPGGGKVFYVLGGSETVPGAACGSGCRYLEAAPVDWNSDRSPDPYFRWGDGAGEVDTCSYKDISGATGTAIGSGFANTAAIMAACPDSSGNNSAPAALAASTYAPTVNDVVVTGWFLPSLAELNALDVSSFGGLETFSTYWSSSQYAAAYAWRSGVGYAALGFLPSAYQGRRGKGAFDLVRPVRAF